MANVEVNLWGVAWAAAFFFCLVVSFSEEIACAVGSENACAYVDSEWAEKLAKKDARRKTAE